MTPQWTSACRGSGRIVLLAALAAHLLVPSPAMSQTARDHAAADSLKTALGVDCAHCHTPGQWSDAGKPAFGIAAGMFRMVDAINARLDGVGRVSCISCHGGATQPSRQPRALLDEQLGRWPAALADAPESRKLAMAVYNVALGVGCDHCHAADWQATEKPAMQKVALMSSLFEIFPKYMPASARTQCYMCHKGSTRPRISSH